MEEGRHACARGTGGTLELPLWPDTRTEAGQGRRRALACRNSMNRVECVVGGTRKQGGVAVMTHSLNMGVKYGFMTCGHVLQFVGGGKLWLQNGASC